MADPKKGDDFPQYTWTIVKIRFYLRLSLQNLSCNQLFLFLWNLQRCKCLSSVACISCPTLYKKLRDLKSPTCKAVILEYDRRFEVGVFFERVSSGMIKFLSKQFKRDRLFDEKKAKKWRCLYSRCFMRAKIDELNNQSISFEGK